MQDKRTDVLYGSLGLIILKTLEALENRVAEPLRVGASLSAVESLLPDLQSITTR